MGPNHPLRRGLAPLVLGLFTWLLAPSQALARALLRVIHGVPGVGDATLKLNGSSAGSIGFGQATRWLSVASGRVTWSLSAAGKTLASGTATIGTGAYDAVLLLRSSQVWLGIYRAQGGRSGTSLVRVIHGAPELGSPELTVDGKPVVARLAYRQATPYLPLTPGAHTLGAMRASDKTWVVQNVKVQVAPGGAYSAIVLGTRGQMVRVLALPDRPGLSASSSATAGIKTHLAAAHTAPGARVRTGRENIVVHSGDCLWTIARREIGSAASNAAVQREVVRIWDLNEERIGTGNPNLIYPGQQLQLPGS